MQILANVVNFVLGLGGAIFLPFMIAILGMFFKMSFFDSFKNGLRIGAGLIGIVIWAAIVAVTLAVCVKVEKLKKSYNIQTYKEISAFICPSLSNG